MPTRALNHKLPRWVPLALALIMTLGLAACGDDTETEPGAGASTPADSQSTPAEEEAASGEIEVQAVEYGFVIPQTIAAGEATFTLKNQGKEQHEFVIVPVVPDAPEIGDLIELPDKELGKFFAGPPERTFAKPGKEGKPLTLDLKPGRYVYVCFIETKGKPHALMGMRGELTVE